MATFMERLAFLQKVPTLMKATADDETPCPGYLFQEIGKISHESSGCGQCLLEYLLERLQVESCHVKLKVLKIFVHLCGHGPSHFLTELRRNSTFIQQASVYSGPPDPVHGTALYQKVRNTAQVRHTGKFIMSRSSSVITSKTLLFYCTGCDYQSLFRGLISQDTNPFYQNCPVWGHFLTFDPPLWSLLFRVEALQLGDCAQEVALINQLTTGSRVFLCREESQHFIKECSTLNCEVVVELLSNKLLDPSLTVKMRALCAVACLMTSDLIFLEQMFKATQRRLHHLAEGPPGPVANKATKMLRQFEALLGGGRKDEGATVSELHSSSTLSEHLLHTLSGEDTDLTRNHPDISPTVVTHTPNYTTTSFTESLSCSTEEIENGPVLPARTAKARDDPGLNTLSLFSGMELVIKHMGPCSPQTSRIESEESDSRLRHSHTHSSDSRKNTSLTGNKNDDSTTLISDHSQSASAFSFLHF
uniref:ENTH domain-containing protein n=1 Tax=Gouania willdenowi TaxID=441366 RepID=A0A8C5EMM3_GOUWI